MAKNDTKLAKELDKQARAILAPIENERRGSKEFEAIFGQYLSFLRDLPLESKRQLSLQTIFLVNGMNYGRYKEVGIRTVGQILDAVKSDDLYPAMIILPGVNGIGEKNRQILIDRFRDIGLDLYGGGY